MTKFARFYKNGKLQEFSMTEIETLITAEKNKELLADIIFHRYYDRFLKQFFYKSTKTKSYTKTVNGKEVTETLNEFNAEYKSGFSIMTNCCLLIEMIATYFEGTNETTKSGSETFKAVFIKAKQYGNNLKVFENETFYKNIRCGLLHQGETYGKFKIRRAGKLFDKTNLIINAMLFCDDLKNFLESYKQELISAKWDSEIWDKCRVKLRYIIKNSK